jgi:hypothetical protein
MSAWPSLVLAALTASAVRIEGEGTCPRAGDVADAVAALLPETAPGAGGVPDRVQIDERDGAIWIRLSSGDGALVGERRLDPGSAAGDCRALASAAAVVVAALRTDVHPEFRERWRPATPPPAAGPATAAVAPPRAPAAAAAAARSAAAAAPAPTTTAPADLGLELGAALGPFWSGDVVLSGAAEATLARAGARLGLRLALRAGTLHGGELPRGVVEWFRLPLTAGARWRTPLGPAAIDLHAGGALALLVAYGSGFDDNRSALGLTAGAAAGARLAWRRAGWAPILGLEVLWWPGRDTLYQAPDGASLALPAVDVGLVAGVMSLR